ncbi:MAG: hypothetical protein EHM91_14600 [Planctomycetota bacterium]|nr:MAG: hypothetical protein EHM91_14600 [Planctomycetota bacterium]
MNIRIEITDPVSEKLKLFGDDAPKVLDRAISKTGSFYRAFVRRNYLSGQMLRRRTGRLYQSMRVRKMRGKKHSYWISGQPRLSNIYDRTGETVIRPKSGGVLRFMGTTHGGMGQVWVFTRRPVYLRPRRFITESSAVYPFQPTFGTAAESEIKKEMRRRNLA